MKSNVRAFLAGLTVGLLGWLAAATLRLENQAGRLAVILVGALAGVAAGRWAGLPGLVLGILVFIPVALQLGVIAFLGESWELYLVIGLALAATGFMGGRLARRSLDQRTRRPG